MNEPPDFADRLARHLDEAAGNTRLRPGSATRVARAARRRSTRRRQLVAAVSVVTAGGVAALGVQQLASTSKPGVNTSDVADQPASPTPPAPGPTPSGPPQATKVDPSLVWRTVHPDSAAAVAADYSSTDGTMMFPGVIVSTAPGRSDTPTMQIWHSDDGVTFTPVDGRPEGRSLMSAYTIGERLYTFGTAPGVAASEPNPLLASVSGDGGETWDEITLPVDTNAISSLPGIGSTATQVNGVAVEDDAVMVLVETYAFPDFEALGIDNPDQTVADVGPDGVRVRTGDCESSTTATTMEVADVEAGSTTTSIVEEGEQGCATTLRTWDQLGVSRQVRAALPGPRQTLLYAPDGHTFTEVNPAPAVRRRTMLLPSSTMHLVSVTDNDGTVRLYRTADGTTWNQLPSAPGEIFTVAEVDGRLVAIHGEGNKLLASTLNGTSWSTVDIGSLTGPGLHHIGPIGAGAAGLAVPVYVESSVATAELSTVPTTITGDAGDATATAAAPDGTVPGTIPAAAGDPPRWYIVHTIDGLTWSVEPLVELLGASDGSPWVRRLAAVGNQLVVTVGLDASNDEAPDDLVALIGTPRG